MSKKKNKVRFGLKNAHYAKATFDEQPINFLLDRNHKKVDIRGPKTRIRAREENSVIWFSCFYSRVTAELNIERSTAYNRKNRALDHLTMLLYGKA